KAIVSDSRCLPPGELAFASLPYNILIFPTLVHIKVRNRQSTSVTCKELRAGLISSQSSPSMQLCRIKEKLRELHVNCYVRYSSGGALGVDCYCVLLHCTGRRRTSHSSAQ